jgi:eukaryotic-like serine/threonine-protein kinase
MEKKQNQRNGAAQNPRGTAATNPRGTAAIKKIGKYEIIAKIAQGGMGALYKARHPTLDRVVLLKKLALQGGGSQFVERFRREARLMMDFKHEHIVQVHDHFKEGSHYYIVEEFVDGISLEALIRRERYLSTDAAMLIFLEVCKALKYAHDKQVIHRDIKPGNVLLSREGDVKLVDFGIATSREEPDDGLTREGTILGTPAYIAPEQIDDARSVDRRADIYSLGVLLYEMITGRTPYPGSFTAETIRLIHRGRYLSARRLNPTASPFLVKVARTCMKVRRARRYQYLAPIIGLLERRIRRHDEESIRSAVRAIVEAKELPALSRRRGSWGGRLLVAFLLGAVLAGAAWFLWSAGIVHEYVLPSRYGALVVSVDLDRARAPVVVPRPVLYREVNGSTRPVERLDFGFRENRARDTAQRTVLESRRLYLPAGQYRIFLGIEGELSFRSFTVRPRTEQRTLLSTLNGQRVAFEPGAGTPLPLEFHVAVFDDPSGRDITAESVLLFFSVDRWIPLGEAIREGIRSGDHYRLRIGSPGHEAQDFEMDVPRFEPVVNIEAHLAPAGAAAGARTAPDTARAPHD